MPTLESVQVPFLQDILEESVKTLQQTEIRGRAIHDTEEEYAIKNIWPMIKHIKILHEYLPIK